MAEPGQQRLRVDVSGLNESKVGEAIKYLKSGDMPPGQGVRIAIASMFYPLAVARGGGQTADIDAAIREARLQFEHYMSLSKADCIGSFQENVRFSRGNSTTELGQDASSPSPSNGKPLIGQFALTEDDGLLDIDKEGI
jgi:hypothetical protein